MTYFDEVLRDAPSVFNETGAKVFFPLAAIGFGLLLADKSARHRLADSKALALALAMMAPWMLLVPWAMLWPPLNIGYPKERWLPILPNYMVVISWPIIGYMFARRMEKERLSLILYFWFTGVGCAFTWFTTVMIVGNSAV